MTENIFTRIHVDRNGNRTPIISMEATHLVNYLNLMLRVKYQEARNALKASLLEGFAPEGMDEKVRKSLRLKKATDRQILAAEQRLEEFDAEYFDVLMSKIWPYIVVGIIRDDTHEGVRKLLQDVYGINDRIVLPELMGTSFTPLLRSGSTNWEEEDDMDDLIENFKEL